MSNDERYFGREQTQVKHFILQKYLQRFAHIVGFHRDTITYVDCFSGPWKGKSEELEDTSFAVALKELRGARETHRLRQRNISLRCFFLEKDPDAFLRLTDYLHNVTDVDVEARNATLEESIGDIVDFVGRGGARSFPFIFIDPSGWTGFAMANIAPLLRLQPCEVLINFMTGHIRRFLDSPLEQTQESFRQLFGNDGFRAKVHGLEGQDRDDAAVEEYARSVRLTGDYSFVCSAIVLNPERDQTHFHLIYATRDRKGVEVFKDVEKKAMEVQEAARADAQQRRQESRTGQPALFSSQDMHTPRHYDSLRERYLERSHGLVVQELSSHRRVRYDDVWSMALSQPLVWESDLKAWIAEWTKSGVMTIEGMQPRQRVPHVGEDNYLVWN